MTDRGWFAGDPADYDRDYAIDLKQLTVFLNSTQPDVCEPLDLANDSPARGFTSSELRKERKIMGPKRPL